MPTKLQSETSRANGAKSKGPKTAEGLAISSKNALKHGLFTREAIADRRHLRELMRQSRMLLREID